MGGFSFFHWLIVLIYLAAIGIPVARVLARTGHSRWWTIVAFIPLANVAALWLFAYAPWKAAEREV